MGNGQAQWVRFGRMRVRTNVELALIEAVYKELVRLHRAERS